MTKLSLLFALIGLLGITAFVIGIKNKAVENTIPEKPRLTQVTNPKDMLPEAIVRVYIDESLKGDEEKVSHLVIESPDSYSIQCESQNSKPQSLSKSDNNLPKIVSEQAVEPKKNDSFSRSSEKFWKLSTSESKISLAYSEAWYIYNTQIGFKYIKILNTESFEDEAVVNVEYGTPNSYNSKRRFLLKNVDGWKVFTTESELDSTELVNKYYAQKRPLCKKDDSN